MFHDKVGLFSDGEGDSVGFRGSLNETYLGLSPSGNIESIDVWPSWEGDRDSERVINARARFDRLWAGDIGGVEVFSLPSAVREVIERIADDSTLVDLFERSTTQLQPAPKVPPAVGGNRLRRHQDAAVKAWEANGHRGLLSHATGSGKTITGLYCVQEMVSRGLTPLIVVPSKLLLEQWERAVKDLLGYRVVLCGAGNDKWSSGHLVRAAVEQRKPSTPYVVIAVLNSASMPGFRAQIRPVVSQVGIIVDEVHRIGSDGARTIMDWLDAPERLGLSATPERANDPTGTAAIYDYFGGIVSRYSLADALEDGILAPYTYQPSWINLNEEEQERWDRLTEEIRRIYAMAQSGDAPGTFADRLKMKLVTRARIAKGAAAKAPRAVELVARTFRPDEGQKWLVYCDDRTQMREVGSALRERGIPSWEYHSKMTGDPETTLRLFEANGGIIVAIKCLDEGVDIPSASHALVLASSRNPREYVQRRGRILRRAPGKTIAALQDVLVLPNFVVESDPTLPLVFGEFARALQFAEWSLSRSAVSLLEQKWIDMGLPMSRLDEMRESGLEDDDDDDE
ncbi:DEAD/DEAH box helicase family protein [Streptomyces sp. MAD19A]|uniref:DEAD/DEAH box helicase family protein n=1 Tax=Streptomyces sp. MAD19A TaxID=3242896 RepID=UPI003527A6B2